MFIPLNPLKHARRHVSRWLAPVIIATLSLSLLAGVNAATPATAGYKDFSYGTSGVASPTASKAESKLWFHDGLWWGSLYNNGLGEYHIYKLNPANLAGGWVDTGVVLDTRNTSRADVLFDGTTLYVVSHGSDEDANPEGDVRPKQFFSFSYNAAAKSWNKIAGPVDITGANGSTESLVISKDGAGRLWTVYVEGTVTNPALQPDDPFRVTAKVKVSTSGDNGATWNTFDLPAVGAADLTGDDVASIVSYQGRTGIMWSNQRTRRFYFATHVDGTPEAAWTSTVVYEDAANPTRKVADDHINLKVQADANGRLFAVIKTGLGEGSPDIVVLQCLTATACASGSGWTASVVYNHPAETAEERTRPILLIDSANQLLHVFTSTAIPGGTIYRKSAAIGTPFNTGPGTPFIQAAGAELTDVTSTKQTLNSAALGTANSGILVLASDTATRSYYYGYVPANTTPPPTPTYKVYLPLVLR